MIRRLLVVLSVVSWASVVDATFEEQNTLTSVARLQEAPSEAVSKTSEPLDIPALVQELTSAEFNVRQRGVRVLQNIPTEQLQQTGEAIEANGSTEAIRRWIDVLELRYNGLELGSESLFYVSETLHRFEKSETWFVSEAAARVLERNWKRQVELAVLQLNRLQFPLDPKDPSRLFQHAPDDFARPTSDRYLKLVIDHSFPKNPEVFEQLTRLAPLRSRIFLRSPQLVSVMMIDGHPLSEDQQVKIKAIFGDIAVQERGPACLGISPDVREIGVEGVLVGSVADGKSADLAGISAGDFIQEMDGEVLPDFEQMVKRLRKYRIGDKVKLTVIRAARPGSSKAEEVEVTLFGWYEGATNAPDK
ncbi:MAG: PDZ domain-containing protein [Planctomycetota bacterium]